MTTIISTLCVLLTALHNSYTAVMNGFLLSAEVTQFAENSIVYKAMLFLNDSGDFVPVVAFRSPFEGKRVLHAVVDYYGYPMSCIRQEGEWIPTNGVSILWGRPDGTAHYTCAPLTEWECFHNLTFITSFGWMKGWTAKEAFEAISFFAYLGTDDSATDGWDYSTIEKWSVHVDDDSILGIVRSGWFRNAYRDAMGMKKPVAPKEQKIIVDTSYRK